MLDGNLNQGPVGATSRRVIVVLPSFSRSGGLRHVPQKDWMTAVMLVHDLLCSALPIRLGPETLSDVDVDLGNTREMVPDFVHQLVPLRNCGFRLRRIYLCSDRIGPPESWSVHVVHDADP